MKLSSANINVMVRACRKAAKNIIRDFGEIEKLQVSLKGPGDFVTASDKKAEKVLIEELQKARPNYSILSEESGKIENDEEFKWIIDPIDGTMNFLHGIPHFAISVGLEHKKEIICGIIFDPIKDEIFLAEKGNGSYLNNQRLRVSSRKKLKECLIVTGGPSFRLSDADKKLSLNEYYKFSSKVMAPIRKMGCASLDMAYVAAGRYDGFWQRNLNYWDVAAGIVLVKEAGGFVTDFEGNNGYIENKTILVTNSKIDEEMLEVLK
jgi:myo-inositol-1(or 4)-monophosphatase|tara:strand:- start:1132 stop:1923 length:792 start_codon:yes stop_codon:yes gene_type:complete